MKVEKTEYQQLGRDLKRCGEFIIIVQGSSSKILPTFHQTCPQIHQDGAEKRNCDHIATSHDLTTSGRCHSDVVLTSQLLIHSTELIRPLRTAPHRSSPWEHPGPEGLQRRWNLKANRGAQGSATRGGRRRVLVEKPKKLEATSWKHQHLIGSMCP